MVVLFGHQESESFTSPLQSSTLPVIGTENFPVKQKCIKLQTAKVVKER